MSIEIWLAYVLTVTIILVVPGPTIILVISQALGHGKKSVVPLVSGVVLGDFTAMVSSLLGLGALLAISAALFTFIKWIGAIYLIYLGISLWRSKPEASRFENGKTGTSNGSLFRSSYVVTALNPKGIVFFVAFLPQFVNSSSPALPQFLVLGGTFLILAAINATLYAVFAGQLREFMKSRNAHLWFNRCGGTALIGAGIATAAIKRV